MTRRLAQISAPRVDLSALPQMATVDQVAALFQVSKSTIATLVYSGDIPSVLIGVRVRRIPRNLLEERLSERVTASA